MNVAAGAVPDPVSDGGLNRNEWLHVAWVCSRRGFARRRRSEDPGCHPGAPPSTSGRASVLDVRVCEALAAGLDGRPQRTPT